MINYTVTLFIKDVLGAAIRSLCRIFSLKNSNPVLPWLEWLFCPERPPFLWFSRSPCPSSTPSGKKRHFPLKVSMKNSPRLLIIMDSSTVRYFPGQMLETNGHKLAWVHRHYPFISSCCVLCQLYKPAIKIIRYTHYLLLNIPLSSSAPWRKPGLASVWAGWCYRQ